MSRRRELLALVSGERAVVRQYLSAYFCCFLQLSGSLSFCVHTTMPLRELRKARRGFCELSGVASLEHCWMALLLCVSARSVWGLTDFVMKAIRSCLEMQQLLLFPAAPFFPFRFQSKQRVLSLGEGSRGPRKQRGTRGCLRTFVLRTFVTSERHWGGGGKAEERSVLTACCSSGP